MFKKVKVNKNKYVRRVEDLDQDEKNKINENVINTNQNNLNLSLNEEKETNTLNNIKNIKSEINKKFQKNITKGTLIKQIPKEEIVPIPIKKEETRESSIKKVFISESQLKEAKNPEEKKKLLGVKREEVDRLKEEQRKGLTEMHKELYQLPDNLKFQSVTKDDHVENLIKLSTAGLIEVPLPLESKFWNNEESDSNKKQVDFKLEEELDYLKVLKKLGPSYAKGYKSDLSHKKIQQLNNVFENVFCGENSRRRKLLKEKVIMENRKLEDI